MRQDPNGAESYSVKTKKEPTGTVILASSSHPGSVFNELEIHLKLFRDPGSIDYVVDRRNPLGWIYSPGNRGEWILARGERARFLTLQKAALETAESILERVKKEGGI